MTYCKLDLSEACKTGYIFAVYRTGVEFGSWDGENIPWKDAYNENELLELHIFDENSEYRAVRTSRRKNEFLSCIITDDSMIKKYKNSMVCTQKIENRMLLFGEEFISSSEGCYTVKESGRIKKFFIDADEMAVNSGIYLKVTDYYDFDENFLMYLSGYRMTGIKKRRN